MKMVNVYDAQGIPALGHIHFLYDLLCEREPHQSISHKGAPSYRAHADFVRSRPYREWFLIEARLMVGLGELPPLSFMGAAYLSNNNEIGVFIAQRFQAMGYGLAAVRYLLDNYQPLPAIPGQRNGHFVANVAPGNEPSRKLFERLGGKLIQVTYQL